MKIKNYFAWMSAVLFVGLLITLDPGSLPIYALPLPFVLLGVSLYGLSTSLSRRLAYEGRTPPLIIVTLLCFTIVLSSLGLIGGRDLVLIGAFTGLLVVYIVIKSDITEL